MEISNIKKIIYPNININMPKCDLCKAKTKDGKPCKNRTCKNFPYCWVHLKSKDKLQVKKSTIKGAGQGLFYVGKKSFPPNKKITEYSSKEVSSKANPKSDYVLEIGRKRYLDSKDKSNFPGRYINDNRNTGKKPNVRFSKGYKIYHKSDRAYVPVKTTKKIKPNTELLANYGRNYRVK